MIQAESIIEAFIDTNQHILYSVNLQTNEIEYYFGNHYSHIGFKKFPENGNKLDYLFSFMDEKSIHTYTEVLKYFQNQKEISVEKKIDYKIKFSQKLCKYFHARFKLRNNTLLIFSKDITEQKKIEEKFVKEERRLKAILENTIQYYFFLDKDYKILYMNTKAKNYFRNEFSQNLFEGYRLIEYLPILDKERFEICFANSFNGNYTTYETAIVISAEKTNWFEISFMPVHENNQITSVCLSLLNITERKESIDRMNEVNQRLIEHSKELEEKVNLRTAELTEEIRIRKLAEENLILSLESETELNYMKSKFISIVSHEFRTPMTVISASTQLLESYSEKYSEEDKKKHFNRIKESINSLTNLIDSVYHANRLAKHEISVNKKPEAIQLLIDDLISKFEVLNPSFQFIKKYQIDRNFLVNVDIHLIRHIMENLLNNAIKYSKNIKQVEVILSLKDDNFIEIIVKDYGIGIPYEDQDKISNRFFRSSNVTNIQGTGVGLSLVKNFIEIQEGEFSFTSVPDVGSEFKVILPI